MVDLFDYLREHYGSIDQYAAKIGVPDQVLARLRRNLLEPAD